jgi:hypothetical protein
LLHLVGQLLTYKGSVEGKSDAYDINSNLLLGRLNAIEFHVLDRYHFAQKEKGNEYKNTGRPCAHCDFYGEM